MKKILSSFILSLFVLGATFAATKPLNLEPIQIDPVIQTDEFGTSYQIDSTFEVIGIICRFAKFDGFTNYYNGEESYTSKIDTLFGKYKDHKAVKKAELLKTKGIKPDAMISLAYYIKPDFSGTIVDFDTFPEGLNPLWKKIKTKEIYEFITLVHDFAKDSNYARIFILNKPDLLGSVGYFNKDSQKYHLSEFTKKFFNNPQNNKTVVSVNMICPGVRYDNFITDVQGNSVNYAGIYPKCYLSEYFLSYFAACCQPVVNYIFDDIKDHFQDFFLKYTKRFITDEKQYKEYEKNFVLYPSLITQFMGMFSILEYMKSPEYLDSIKDEDYPLTYEAFYSTFEKQFDGGFFYDAVKLFEEYSANRQTYPSIMDFAPKIADFINSISLSEAE